MSNNPKKEDTIEERVVSSDLRSADDADRYLTPTERQLARDQAIRARNERQNEENIISDFIIASKTGDYLEAKVGGVEIADNDVYWVCYVGPIAVRIPFEETFENLPAELLDKSTARLLIRRRQFLAKAIDVTIPFIVTSFVADPNGSYVAIGSRVAALKAIRRRYYGPKAIKPIRKGDKVDARIIIIGPSVLWLNIWGADVRVANRNMSHRYLHDMTEVFYPDDMIKVQVMDIQTNADGSVEMSVSRRPIELEEAQKRYHLIKPGNRYSAIITSIRNKPSMHVEMWLEGVNIPAYAATKNVTLRTDYSNNGGYHSGDHVYVEVIGITEKNFVHVKLLPGKGRAGRR